jgi:G3E family GTPase
VDSDHEATQAAAGQPRLPALLLGGWLGAGKTTLLNRLLREARGRRVAVLVNDFGQVNLDADLIVGAEAGVLQLAGGCLCCSFGDDLFGTLRRVAAREPPPDCLVIELSGVALPRAVSSLVQLVPEVSLIGSLVLADATQVRRQITDPYVGDTVREQLVGADWLLVSKTDLLEPEAQRELRDWLRGQLPGARVLPGAASAVPVELLLGWTDEGAAREMPLAAAARSDEEAQARFAGRPLHSVHPQLASRSLALPPGADLQRWLKALDDPGWGVLRAKARVGDGEGRGRVLQWAAGRGEITAAAVPQPGGHLVLIGLDGGRLDALVAALAPAPR